MWGLLLIWLFEKIALQNQKSIFFRIFPACLFCAFTIVGLSFMTLLTSSFLSSGSPKRVWNKMAAAELNQKENRPWAALSLCKETHGKRKLALIWSRFLEKQNYCYSENKHIWKEKVLDLDNWLLQNSLQSSWHTSFNEYYNNYQHHQHYTRK